MAIAFVFFNVEHGVEEEEVVRYLKTLPPVKEACVTYGVYDGVARIEIGGVREYDPLKEFIADKIRTYEIKKNGEIIKPIRSTLTSIVVEG